MLLKASWLFLLLCLVTLTYEEDKKVTWFPSSLTFSSLDHQHWLPRRTVRAGGAQVSDNPLACPSKTELTLTGPSPRIQHSHPVTGSGLGERSVLRVTPDFWHCSYQCMSVLHWEAVKRMGTLSVRSPVPLPWEAT